MKAKSFVPRLAAAAVSCLAMMVVLSTFTFEHRERFASLNAKGSFPLYGFRLQGDAEGLFAKFRIVVVFEQFEFRSKLSRSFPQGIILS